MRRWLRPGDLVVVLLLVMPLVAAGARVVPTGDPAVVLGALGRALGIVGLAAMLLAGALSIRIPGFDRPFGGLTRLWGVHRLLGLVAFVAVLAHVLLMALAAVPVALPAAMATLFPTGPGAWPAWVGWGALVAMVIFLAPTFEFFGEPHYQRWKRLHLVSAVALVLALVHTFPLTRERWPWVLFGALAFAAYAWRKGLSLPLGRREYAVSDVRRLAEGVVEIGLTPVGRPITYRPGQFVYFTPMDRNLAAGCGEEHPFTIASAPGDALLRLGIKDLGDASGALQRVSLGSQAFVEGPYGDFFEAGAPERARLWIGGGIGITPFVSAVRALAGEPRTSPPVHLFYLANDPERSYYLDALVPAAESVEGLELTVHHFTEQGPLGAEFLQRHCPDFADREVWICGPPPMTRHVRAVLRAEGVARRYIHSEEFDFL